MKKIFLTIFIAVAITVSLLPYIDNLGYENNSKFLKRSIATFAIAKGLNGVISLLQGTEIGGSVIFANATFSIGEILDPLNDMVERFSWVMLASSIALGVEKILIQISSTMTLKYIFLGIGTLLISSLWYKKISIIQHWTLKIFLVLLLVRFIMPLTEIANAQIYSHITQSTYKDAQISLGKTQKILDSVNRDINQADKENRTILSSISSTFDFSLEEKFKNLKLKLNTSYENMVSLMIIFIFQTVLFPLVILSISFKLTLYILLKNKK